jgi:UTP--glucose-1-phosphate uridylyltransferase
VKVTKAVITAAAREQRDLPLQRLVDRDGVTKSVLAIVVEEALRAGIKDVCIVVCPGDEAAYRAAADAHKGKLCFVPQAQARGYGHAVWCAREFVGDAPFFHMVSDHIYIRTHGAVGFAQQVVEVAEANDCAVSGVQPTRENLLPYFGTVGGQRVKGTPDQYVVERVVEKPTPTEAEQSLLIPGLRAGYYLCFIGMHVLTPTVMDLLGEQVETAGAGHRIELSPVLSEMARRERYLAVEAPGRRIPVDTRYGLLMAQLALGLSGQDRDEVLTGLTELLADRELRAAAAR